MKQAHEMIESLRPVVEQLTGRIVGSADDEAQALDILSRNGIEWDTVGEYEGMKAWYFNGKLVGYWDEEKEVGEGDVWRVDDAFTPGPNASAPNGGPDGLTARPIHRGQIPTK